MCQDHLFGDQEYFSNRIIKITHKLQSNSKGIFIILKKSNFALIITSKVIETTRVQGKHVLQT